MIFTEVTWHFCFFKVQLTIVKTSVKKMGGGGCFDPTLKRQIQSLNSLQTVSKVSDLSSTITMTAYCYTTKLLGGGGGGYTGFTPSVCPSVCPATRVRYVAPTLLVGSISYFYILSSNFRGCVACNVYFKISKVEF